MGQKVLGSNHFSVSQPSKNSINPAVDGDFFQIRKGYGIRERDGLGQSYAVPKIQSSSNPHSPYSHHPRGNIYLYLLHIN